MYRPSTNRDFRSCFASTRPYYLNLSSLHPLSTTTSISQWTACLDNNVPFEQAAVDLRSPQPCWSAQKLHDAVPAAPSWSLFSPPNYNLTTLAVDTTTTTSSSSPTATYCSPITMDDDLASVFPSDPLPPTAALDPGTVDEYLGMKLFPTDDYADSISCAVQTIQTTPSLLAKEEHASDKLFWDRLCPFPPFSPELEVSSFGQVTERAMAFMSRSPLLLHSPLPSPPSTDIESVHSHSSNRSTFEGDLGDYPAENGNDPAVVNPMQLWQVDPVCDTHPLFETFNQLNTLTNLPRGSLSNLLGSMLDNVAVTLRSWPQQRTSQYPGDNTIRAHIHQLLCKLKDFVAYQEETHGFVRYSTLLQELQDLVLYQGHYSQSNMEVSTKDADTVWPSSSEEEEEEQEDEDYVDTYSKGRRRDMWKRTMQEEVPCLPESDDQDAASNADDRVRAKVASPVYTVEEEEEEDDEEEEDEDEEDEEVDVMSEDDEDYETISYSSSRRSSSHSGRKTRKNYKPEQTKILMTFYLTHDGNTPDVKSKAYLAKETSLSVGQISTWFQNARRRQKDKLQKFKELSETYPEDVYDYNSFTRFTEHKCENAKKRRSSEQHVPAVKRRK
ncbi:hypothetical protein EC973_002092 [Apophysomyces ossiformis]|uniref:Homeobox domain-containing protein n=1 Tax=Apophysomyces ossiformis TaxID=679940 RepID=A0A8H7ERG0_9FUNG|nr:hypothetical protein EC973_002092 [Apophysomyces ossiformis]